ncbi:aldo/keto reductase [Microvirga sp. VF16]|uniref:aldo/keto reductase n=1 Tax=Microvirga sp. VF16 TaxID=2807101 RepID=UPI0035305589
MPFVEANGARIPALGLGTWPLRGEVCSNAVQWALEMGYRHIDTAAMYDNEAAVGAGLKASGVPQDEVFITTKVWHSDLKPDDLRRSAEASLRRLGLSSVDLLLIHGPNKNISLAATMRALSDAKRQGLARHIGVSNFSAPLLEKAVQLAGEPLVINQCEYHPYLDQSRTRAACQKHGIAFASYSPLGQGGLTERRIIRAAVSALGKGFVAPFVWGTALLLDRNALLIDPTILAIASAHGKTAAQVVLRWHLQQPATIAIPRSCNQHRIAENLDIFNFELSDQQMERISALRRLDGQ